MSKEPDTTSSETPESPPRDDAPHREPVEHHPPPKVSAGGDLTPVRTTWWGRVFRPRAQREQQLQTLQAGYVEMLEMMRSISTHLDRQADTQVELAKAMQHFPDAVEGLKHVGEATAQQTEVMGLVREQLERNATHEQEIVGSMNNFNQTLGQMDETSRNTTQSIAHLVDRAKESEQDLRGMMERSEKRLTMLTSLMGLLAFAAVIFAIVMAFHYRPAPPQPVLTQPPPTVPAAPAKPAPTVHASPAPEVPPAPAPEPVDVVAEEPPAEPDAAIEEAIEVVEAEVESMPEPEPEPVDGVAEEPPAEPNAVIEEVIEESVESVAAEVEAVEETVEEPPAEEEDDPESPPAEAEDPPEALPESAVLPSPSAVITLADGSSRPRRGIRGVARRLFSFWGEEDASEGEE